MQVSQSLSSGASHAGAPPGTVDLGPLAWVLGEIQKSLDSAGKSLRRHLHDAGQSSAPDLVPLRQARQQLHQAVGALQMVGQDAPALVLGAMEFAVQGFVLEPQRCSEAALEKIERGGFAVAEFLQTLLSGKSVSPVALFPQYRDVLELAGTERVHPADLWSRPWRWADVRMPRSRPALVFDPAVRSQLDREVLTVIRSGDEQAAGRLRSLCLGLSFGAQNRHAGTFWALAAGAFEAVALGLIPTDIYAKRAASRVLMQYVTLARDESAVSEVLAHDLLFLCAQARPGAADKADTLRAVRAAWEISDISAADYTTAQFGRFDPVLLAQARKRIGAAKEMWSALSGGDVSRVRQAADTFSQLSESLQKLHPPSLPMAHALTDAVEASALSGKPPATELAMEVATSVLYLEAAFEDLDPHDRQLTARTVQLAGRIDRARAGGRSEPLESWMEELYRRISDRQTMGTVVDELRGHLSELEKSLDQYFRRPAEKDLLKTVPGQLLQMRGVFSVLGLDQAAQTVMRMRGEVERLLTEGSAAGVSGDFDLLGNNLGALGFLIDMLGYQPTLAKRLFVFDEQTGELKPLMGRQAEEASADVADATDDASTVAVSAQEAAIRATRQAVTEPAALHAVTPVDLPPLPMLEDDPASSMEEFSRATESWTSKITGPAPLETLPDTEVTEYEEDDLQDIFLTEAREVLLDGMNAVKAMSEDAGDLDQQTVLRRAFHTLKGSSRMVGLTVFGEAAWAFEQLMNTWLADQRPANAELSSVTGKALRDFGKWVQAIAAGTAQDFKAEPFVRSADALRLGEVALAPAPRVADADALAGAARQIAAAGEPTASKADASEFAATAFEAPPWDAETARAEPEAPTEWAGFHLRGTEDTAAPTDSPKVTAKIDDKADDKADERANAGLLERRDFEKTDFFDRRDFADTDLQAALEPDVSEPQSAAVPPAGADEIDFLATAAAPLSSAYAPTALSPLSELGNADAHAEAEATAEPAETAETAETEEQSADDEVKAIGPLRIGIALYNVYLSEADEWSRQLATEIGEWALEPHTQVSDSTVGLAHALAGSSATVGFQSLSGMARSVEAALQHLHMQGRGLPEHGTVLVAAADELRRLLHQFAAGFLKEPEAGTLQALREVAQSALPADQSGAVNAIAPSLESLAAEKDRQTETRAAELQEAKAKAEMVADAKADARPEADVADSSAAPSQAVPSSGHVKPAPIALVRQELRATEVSLEDEDENNPIDVADAIDAELFPIFEEEAAELLPQLSAALRGWSRHLGDPAPRAATLRTLHTLKGSARLAGAMRLGERAHRMESEIELIGTESIGQSSVDALLARFDALQAAFDALRAQDGVTQEPAHVPEVAPVAGTVSSAQSQSETANAGEDATSRVRTTGMALPTPAALSPLRQASGQVVRIRTQLLDRLVAETGEVIITRTRLEAEQRQLRSSLDDLTANLDRLRQQLRDIEVQAETQMQSRLAQTKDAQQVFDPLEFDRFTRVQELTRMMAESVNDVATVQRTIQRTVQANEDALTAQARQTRELQRGLLRTRMVQFEDLSERLYRVVRQASKDTGKQVRLDITGGSIEMDRGVLERMTPAFEHLLRNCVAHGIEDAAVRAEAGKDAGGVIAIELHHEGNDVSISFRDDGAGLDHDAIVARAKVLGLIGADASLSAAEAADLIFKAGFSTAGQVSELAGRGIGMDVVRAQTTAIGGRIETHSEAGRGTTFKLVLPLTTAVTHVVMMRFGNVSIGVPSNLFETVRRVTASELKAAYASQQYTFGDDAVPFYWAGALLQSSARSERPIGKSNTVIVVRSAAQRVALHVDEVLGNQEVVVKNLGPQLAGLAGMAGITLLASGEAALIYNPVALATVHGEQARQLQGSQVEAAKADEPMAVAATDARVARPDSLRGLPDSRRRAAPVAPLVLVVDDSITVRRVTQRLLQREGYRVELAIDGLQALEKLAGERPTVVLSDIEMPRMDGFDLARNIRGDQALADLPIIMITSRIAEKHREHAEKLGVNHYLGKPYSEEELLRLVGHYARGEVPTALAA